MSIFVKICGLQTRAEVAVAVSAGANAIGFVLAPSVRQISATAAAELSASVPDNVKCVAVMLHATNAELRAILKDFRPDVIQTDAPDFARLGVPGGIERWPVFREGDSPASTTDTYVYEGKKSGAGQTVNWDKAAKIARQGRMILAGGLAASNVAAAIATARPFGVDVSSAVESAPGVKDARLINEFISAVRSAESNL